MCGITGVYDMRHQRQVEEPLLIKMATELYHRGPDESSYYVNGTMGFGFRRLSIVDILNGHQPFFNEDRSIALVCNGEIFNYRELRTFLEKKGYRFRTTCDIEVIVYLYEEFGPDCIRQLNGQFALAIFDGREDRLLLARDQFGICPLFYTLTNGLLIFASEIKAILQHPMVEREVDLRGLDQVLTFPGPVSPVTMFKNISSLPPGHSMIVKDDVSIRQFWDLCYPEEPVAVTRPDAYYIDRLEELLLASVKRRLLADVPVGFYLSGGLDSSLIGALMRTITPDVEYPSFSIEFPSDEEMNEQSYQQQMVAFLKSPRNGIRFDSMEIEKRLRQAVWAAECALKESYNTCSLALSEAVKRSGIKVILSGEGADELFGGYVGYRFDKQRSPSRGIRELDEMMEDEYRMKLWGDADFFYEKNYYEFAGVRRSLYSPRLCEAFDTFHSAGSLSFDKTKIRNRHILHKRSYIDLKLRLSDHLISDHCDRVTYANSVEGRFPFLDVDLVEFIATVPPDLKLNGLVEKYILKKMAGRYIPPAIADRQKFGFVAPGSPSLLRQNIDWINDLLSYERIKRQGYFDADVVEGLKKRYSAPGFRLNLPFDSDLLIVVLTFNIFLDLFGMPDK